MFCQNVDANDFVKYMVAKVQAYGFYFAGSKILRSSLKFSRIHFLPCCMPFYPIESAYQSLCNHYLRGPVNSLETSWDCFFRSSDTKQVFLQHLRDLTFDFLKQLWLNFQSLGLHNLLQHTCEACGQPLPAKKTP